MNKLREKFSIHKGFIPNSKIEAGKEYLAYANESEERVYINSIVENGVGHYDVELVYESDRSTDHWHLYPDDKVFKTTLNLYKKRKNL
ncbi:MAG: hypothetical protein HC831_13485 [Chloroflexia bacterium]|nr:hypothetical protein [Chloroflexia bacterium]